MVTFSEEKYILFCYRHETRTFFSQIPFCTFIRSRCSIFFFSVTCFSRANMQNPTRCNLKEKNISSACVHVNAHTQTRTRKYFKYFHLLKAQLSTIHSCLPATLPANLNNLQEIQTYTCFLHYQALAQRSRGVRIYLIVDVWLLFGWPDGDPLRGASSALIRP